MKRAWQIFCRRHHPPLFSPRRAMLTPLEATASRQPPLALSPLCPSKCEPHPTSRSVLYEKIGGSAVCDKRAGSSGESGRRGDELIGDPLCDIGGVRRWQSKDDVLEAGGDRLADRIPGDAGLVAGDGQVDRAGDRGGV